MQNEKPIVAVEFSIKILGKKEIVDSELSIVRVRQGWTKEKVQSEDGYYNIKDIFDDVILDIKYNIRVKCKCETDGYINIYVTTNTIEFLAGSWWNSFPSHPSENEIENLKLIVKRIRNKVKKFKE